MPFILSGITAVMCLDMRAGADKHGYTNVQLVSLSTLDDAAPKMGQSSDGTLGLATCSTLRS